ncbi:protein SUPPRESSOR OF npr1-1, CONSTITUTIVE 1-like [Dorcoceras hygrometricum]|uniref:Protein SUPPRESSOR OF npr1-1, CONSTITUTIVE 1-like n=1 Tax=Dorcoceras hygrometricum TaxID=472368 RepID=A0A2Z7BVX6_9LAMI|nr:protein SUPPRESSOR OF npr1-1, CONSTITUTIVE 1-like [Dorcoceras hygrometricum]
MKRRRAEESADGLALMTSSMTSTYSADGLREQSQDISRCYLEIAIAKRCRLHKLIRQHFALALKIQQMLFALKIQQSQDTSWKHMFNTSWTTRRKQQQHPVYPVAGNPDAKNRRSSKAQQLKNEPAAKQLTTYEEFTKDGCQLLSSIQMAKTTRSLQKKRTQVLFPVVSHTVAAVVYLWSLGVLTAAGCGIGSVHELTGFSLDELSGCASLGQMPSFYFHCAVRSLGARLSDKHMGRDRRMKNLSCSLYWFFIDLSNSVALVHLKYLDALMYFKLFCFADFSSS